MRPATALLLVFVLIATAGLAVAEQKLLDPFAAFPMAPFTFPVPP